MIIFCCNVDRRDVEIGSMVAAYDIGAIPVNGFLVFDFKKDTRNKSAAADDKPPHAVDVFVTLFFP